MSLQGESVQSYSEHDPKYLYAPHADSAGGMDGVMPVPRLTCIELVMKMQSTLRWHSQ